MVGKIHWRRKWQPTPVFLPRKCHGQRSLVGYSPWGCKELDMTEQLHFLSYFCFYFYCFGKLTLENIGTFMLMFLPMFSSGNFMVSCLIFKSLRHFEFIFMYGVRVCSNFIDLHAAIQLSQKHLPKRLSFLHRIFLPPFLKKN